MTAEQYVRLANAKLRALCDPAPVGVELLSYTTGGRYSDTMLATAVARCLGGQRCRTEVDFLVYTILKGEA